MGSFQPATMPILSRGQFLREMQAWSLLPVMLGLIEGSVAGVLVKIGFAPLVAAGDLSKTSLDIAVALLAAAPAFANILNFVWATLSYGRAKIRFAVSLMTVTAILVSTVAVAPRSAFGLWLIVLSIVGARVCWSGVISLRSTIWRANYPSRDRARMAGNFSAVQAVTMSCSALVLGQALEMWDDAFRIAYPLGALLGLLGAWSYSRLRVRGHRALLASEKSHAALSKAGAVFDPAAFVRVLRDDARFRSYMSAMFVFGFGNLMIMAPLVILMTERFSLTERPSMIIASAIPLGLMPVAIPFWSQLFDRTNILVYRSVHCWTYVAAIGLILVAALTRQSVLLYLSSVFLGVANAGGVLGWNLGHHDFAPKHLASYYMGVHVTLTGLRGMMAPFLAVPLYRWFEYWRPGMGGLVFGVCLLFTLTGAVWFQFIRRRYAGTMERGLDS